jgi:hypothetical protein
MIRTSAKLTALATAALLGSIAAVNCSKTNTDEASVGRVNLALTLPSGSKINAVTYKITSGTPAGTVSTGSINTADPNATPSAFVSFPPSTGDTVELDATTTAGVACTGTSMPFPVVGGGVAMVNVTLLCGGSLSNTTKTGSVDINGTVVEGDNCPTLTAWMGSPLQTSVGSSINVSATATDPDAGETLTYAWTSSNGGAFVAPGSATTTFVCGNAGAANLTVLVTDSHVPTSCSTSITIPVNCVGTAAGTAGATGTAGAGTAGATGTAGAGTAGATGTAGAGTAGTTGTAGAGTAGATGTAGAGTAGATGTAGAGTAGATGTAGAGPTACQTCELKGSNVDGTCFNTVTPTVGSTTTFTNFGCNGFTGADLTNCNALLACLHTTQCTAQITSDASMFSDYGEPTTSSAGTGAFDDPTPCLCGAISKTACLGSTQASLTGVCAPQYIAAAAGGSVFGLFFEPASPVGISNNLYFCDHDEACTSCE